MDFAHPIYTSISPLAAKLFDIEGVTRVYFGSDFITVTKDDDFDWPFVKPDISKTI